MKRSNLIILILILLIPTGLLMHNLALRAEFKNVKAQPESTYEGEQRYRRKLPVYNHIVLEGGVRLKGGRRKKVSIYNVEAQVWVGNVTEPELEFRADMKPFLKTEVRNDTLFCSFEADNFRDWRSVVRSYRELSIKVPKIASIQADSLHLNIFQLAQHGPVNLQFLQLGVANISYVDVPRLNLKSNAMYMHISGGKMDTLQYELGDQASLAVSKGVVIGKKEMVKVGKHSSFNISGIIADSAMVKGK
ncbi:hypothetical protein [Chitinophaga rhizosphaerae]|uniref:hypothetical protein n=1 Tax=Chitinophaga rhizosphaerae TaxID=1864947 RepID=UPI000F80FF35|nr:hypothetical protein [Chitinophaga rhizosphaerae]